MARSPAPARYDRILQKLNLRYRVQAVVFDETGLVTPGGDA